MTVDVSMKAAVSNPPCQKVRESLVEYLSGNLEPADRDAVSTHLLSCRACLFAAAELAQWRASMRSATSAGPEVQERLWRAVLAEVAPSVPQDSDVRRLPSTAGLSPANVPPPVAAPWPIPGLDLLGHVVLWVAGVSRPRLPQVALALPMGLSLDLPLFRRR